MNKFYSGKIIKGKNLASKLGFPTINLDNTKVIKEKKRGVYAAQIIINGKKYDGVFYFGPRLILGESKDIVEIYLFDFNQKIYGKTISYNLIKFIRPAKKFKNILSFQKQLEKDVQKAKQILQKLSLAEKF